MPSYELDLVIQAQDLDAITAAGEKVVLIKQASSGKSVAWVTFSPFEYNTVNWTEHYGLYASTSSVESGASIHEVSVIEAQPKLSYPFQGNRFQSPTPDPKLGDGSYEIVNDADDWPWLTFGLAQPARLNGASLDATPINAVVVPRRHDAEFTPYEKVIVYLEAEVDTGLVVSEVESPQLTVEFGGNVTSHTVSYDSNSGMFVLSS